LRRITLTRALWALLGAGGVVCVLILTEKSTGSLGCPTAGCTVVQRSAYAHVFGMPLAVAGLLGYLAVGGSLLLHGWRGRVAAAGLATGGALFALYLVAVQVFVIDAVCIWCVVNDTLAVAIAVLLCVQLVRRHGELDLG
jgi:uncharacterized membrane protein